MKIHYNSFGLIVNSCNEKLEGNVTYNKSEVTCERCLAALRSREGASAPGCLAAPSSAPAEAVDESLPRTRAALDAYVRLAVLAAEQKQSARLTEMGLAFTKQQVRLKMLAEQWAHGKAVKLLLAHEWVLDGRECISYCLHCGSQQHKGHSDDCEGFGPQGVIPPDVKAAM